MRQQLVERRGLIAGALTRAQEQDVLRSLLQEVDAALERFAHGSFGLCETCSDPIENDRLATNPLLRHCIDHLTTQEQRALEADLDTARDVQHNLLPREPFRTSRLHTAFAYDPAGTVSGDYLDLIPNDSDELLFFVGDISGKGLAASLLMSRLHAIVRTLAATQTDLSRLFQQANRLFCEGTLSTHFATLAAGHVCPDGTVDLCNAGHCPVLHVHADGGVDAIPSSGIPLGIFCNSAYDACRVTLAPGDALVLYTDGVTEARNPDGLFYGEDRLHALAARKNPTAEGFVNTVVNELRTHRNGAAKYDDTTLLVVQRMA
jgi:sigma-B regulation protein RsbU (phosphoserine phosphatase)